LIHQPRIYLPTWPAGVTLLLALLCAVFAGCSRTWFRKKADTAAYEALAELGGYPFEDSVYPLPNARFYDPYSVDCPPMPPDDPQSHQLMREVDGMKGYQHWDKNGSIDSIESSDWLATLPRDGDGEVQLDLTGAIQVGRSNSRDFQRNLEVLYLSALDVTGQQFQFEHQFLAGNVFRQNYFGRDVGGSSRTEVDSFAVLRKGYATGGELLIGVANSLVWDAWGAGSEAFSSTLDFALRQPLLRFGGRARVLEQLTQSERDLLANIRQMEMFRQGFYVNLTTGRVTGSGPSLGANVGQAGLGLVAGFPSGRNGAPSAGGFLGLLQDQQEIRNQEANVSALRDSAAQLEAAFEANRISSRLQVDQARQALLNAQSSLLTSRAAYDSRVDAYKITLGLPPQMPVAIRDPLLDRFMLIDPALTKLQDEVSQRLLTIRRNRSAPNREELSECVRGLQRLDPDIVVQTEQVVDNLKKLVDIIPERIQQLDRVARQVDTLNADVDPRVYDPELFQKRVDELLSRVPKIAGMLVETEEQRTLIANEMESISLPELQRQLVAHATEVSDLLLELSLLNAETKLQGISLLPVDIDSAQAVDYARFNRLDWMNARANLVDSWRKIEVVANDLKSDLDVVVEGELGTPLNDSFNFTSRESKLRMRLEFDTPTARVIERNRYRASLISYQQARRSYMLFEDRVAQSIQNTVRIINLSQINLEVRRAAVQVAIAQVDIARLRLNPPVRPNQPSRTSPTAARDLVSALTDLLDAQNDLLNVWVSYEALRILLDFEMGTMQLDPVGMWIDPGPWTNEMELNQLEREQLELDLLKQVPAISEALNDDPKIFEELELPNPRP
jgi:hypothetical protein